MQRVDIASCDKLVRTVETLSSYYRDASDLVFAVCHELGGMYDAAFDVHTHVRLAAHLQVENITHECERDERVV